MSNFSFSHCVFKRLVIQTRKNQGLFGKRLTLSSFTLNKNLNLSKLQVFAVDSLDVAQVLDFVTDMIENVEKEENAGYQHFFLFILFFKGISFQGYQLFLLLPLCFQKPSFSESLTHSHTMTPFDAPEKQAF